MEWDLYLSPNNYEFYELFGRQTPWGWKITDSQYIEDDDETVVTVLIGYERQLQTDYLHFDGNIIGDEIKYALTLAAFQNSDGPIKGVGFPPPPNP